MLRESWKNCLIRVMGSKVWDVQELQTVFNQNWKQGACSNELVNKMRAMKEIHIVGKTSIHQGWIRSNKTPGYKLWQVKEEWRVSQ